MFVHSLIACVLLAVQGGDVSPAAVVRPSQPAAERALDASLGQLVRARREQGEAGLRELAVRRSIEFAPDSTLEFEIVRAGKGPALAALVAAGCTLEAADDDGVTVRATLDVAATLKATVPGIADVRLSPVAKSFAVSQGVALTGAFSAQGAGVDGAGARIAIIDTGFLGYAQLVAAGEIPAATATKNFTNNGLEVGSDHGAAVALIVHQMAPAASIFLVKIGTLAQWKKAIDWAIDAHIDVFNASIGFPAANYSDGTGSAASATNKARKHGILPVIAMGNYGDSHWIGSFADDDNDKLLNVTPTSELLRISAQAGADIEIFLVWDDFPTSNIDLDLFLFDLGTLANPKPPTAQNVIATSTFDQTGFQSPVEVIQVKAPATGLYGIVVNRVGKKPSQLQVFSSHPILDGLNQPQSSLMTPADADGAIAVAAMGYFAWTTGPVEAFSSRGPRTDGAAKPQITGPDGVANTIYPPFFGTSAAAPHVAGAAGLLKSAQPGLTANDLATRLQTYAVPMGDPNEFGGGRLALAADFVPPTPDPAEFDVAAFVVTPTAITLAAMPTQDASLPLSFAFDFTGTAKEGTDSGWQSQPTFVDDLLKPNRKYTYRFRVQDSAIIPNTSRWSAPVIVYTHAFVPPAPLASKIKSTGFTLKLDSGGNPNSVLFAVQNMTTGTWLTPGGVSAGGPVFAPRTKWKSVKVKGLLPATSYEFRARAINAANVETALSDPLMLTTLP